MKKNLLTFVLVTLAGLSGAAAEPVKILNVSYDVTREFYTVYNVAFQKYWKGKTGQDVTINQSNGGSSKQARSVIDGLEADVVTFNQDIDINVLHDKADLVSDDWRTQFPNHSSPYTTTIVFLVRKGNPKNIRDWDDLVKPGISIVLPNPKTSGNGRYSYLAAYAYAKKKFGDDETKARAFIKSLVQNIPVLDTGGRGATTTFVQHQIGDVLLTFENEVYLINRVFNPDEYDVVYPSVSILVEPPVAVVDKVVNRRGTREIAQAYLQYLYSPEGQRIAAKNFFRPRLAEAASASPVPFPKIDLITIDDAFGGWKNAQKVHFDDGGIYDQIFAP